MKRLKNILAIMLLAIALVACKNEAIPEVKTVEVSESEKSEVVELDPNAEYAKAEFTINGMTCEMGCAKTIEKKMAKMEGVKSAKVDFGKKLAMVEYDQAKVTPASLEEAVAKVGKMYEVEDMKTVEDFSDKKSCSKECMKKCENKSEAEKKACAKKCAEKKEKA